jgi:type II secretory pathway pseudopilin PulG
MNNKYKAFTLIEVTLSIILIGALIAITTPLVSSITIRNDLSSAHESLYNALLRAQNLSKTNYKNAQWRVCINNTSKTYIITAGTCASNLYPETIKIGSEVEVSSTQTLDIPFKIGGELDYNNNFIRVTLSGGGVSKSILITKDGVIDKVSTTDPSITIPNYSIVTNGLVMHLDAGNTTSYTETGTLWTDLTGNGNNVSMVNSGSITWNNVNNVKYFSTGTNGYFSGPGSVSIPIGNSSYTMQVWLRLPTWRLRAGIISIGEFGYTNRSNAFRTNDIGIGQFVNYWWDHDLYANNNIANITEGVWFFATAQFDGTSRKIWINTTNVANDIPGNSHNVLTSQIQIASPAISDNSLNGDISVAYIYNRALTETEIQQNFNALKSRFGL